jgi:hypothetical protein
VPSNYAANPSVKRLTVDLDSQDHKRFKVLACENQTTMSEIVIGLLRGAGYIKATTKDLNKDLEEGPNPA